LLRDGKVLRFDAGYTRWLSGDSKGMLRSQGVTEHALTAVAWLERGLVATTADGKLLVTEGPLGPWRMAVARSLPIRILRTYQGTLTIEQGHRIGILPSMPQPGRELEVHWLDEFEGRPVLDAQLDASGRGLVVFSPQRLAETADFGHTYRAIADDGVLALALRVDGSRVIVSPGGVHDVFARAYVIGSGKLERSLNVPEEGQPYATVGEATAWTAPPSINNGTTLDFSRFSMASDSGTGNRFVVDGDTVIYHAAKPLLKFSLGQPVDDSDSGPTTTRSEWSSACGGTLALGYHQAVYVRRGQGQWRNLELPAPEGGKWSESNRLRGMTLLTSRHLVYRVNDSAYLVDIDLSRPQPRLVASDLDTLEFESGCSSDLPAEVWGSDYRHFRTSAFTVRPDGGAAVKATSLGNELARDATWMTNLDDGTQLFRTGEGISRVTPQGHVEVVTLPRPPTPPTSPSSGRSNAGYILGFGMSREGRGLYIDQATGDLWQTLDGARTFTRTRGIGRSLSGKRVFCTRNRCEVENQVVRVGWDETPVAVVDQPKTTTRGWQIECHDARPIPLPGGLSSASIEEPVARLDSEDWAAAVTEAKPRPSDESMSVLGPYTDNKQGFIAMRGGTLEYFPLNRWFGPVTASGLRVYASENLVGLISSAGGEAGISGQLSIETWLIPNEPHQPPRKLKLNPGEFGYASYGFSLVPEGFVTRDGVAFVDGHTRRLFLLDRRGTATQRTWHGDVEAPYARPTLQRAKDGSLFIASRTPNEMTLISIDSDDYVRDVQLAVKPTVEAGVGILDESSGRSLVMPVDRGEERQLYRFPLDERMRLGPGEPFGTSQLTPYGLLEFSPCRGASEGASYFELTVDKVVVFVDGERHEGTLRRVLRLGASSTGSPDAAPEICVANAQFLALAPEEWSGGPAPSLKILWRSFEEPALLWTPRDKLVQASCPFVSQP
jgi:hypothetical protein